MPEHYTELAKTRSNLRRIEIALSISMIEALLKDQAVTIEADGTWICLTKLESEDGATV